MTRVTCAKWRLKQVVCLQHNVSQQEVVRGCREQKFKDVIFDIASEANHELQTVHDLHFNAYCCDVEPVILFLLQVKSSRDILSKEAFPGFLPSVI